MKRILMSVTMALAMLAGAPVFATAATAAPPASATFQAMGAQSDPGPASAAVAAASPTPSDTASTSPANPGTGETAEQEGTRLDYAPWVIGAIALVTLVVVLIWRRRRNTTIV
jgi:cobalamin biosynthesis Mg chelatase CobN